MAARILNNSLLPEVVFCDYSVFIHNSAQIQHTPHTQLVSQLQTAAAVTGAEGSESCLV